MISKRNTAPISPFEAQSKMTIASKFHSTRAKQIKHKH